MNMLKQILFTLLFTWALVAVMGACSISMPAARASVGTVR